jgi:outer membrane murein-binding lipoprotein Lpp
LQQQIDKANEVRGKAQAARDEAKRVREDLDNGKTLSNGVLKPIRNSH